MPSKWEAYSTNADANTGAPPIGAPEGMRADALNNTMRHMMAGIKELGNELRTGEADGTGEGGTDSYGTMAQQDADAVDITGGTVAITSGTGITGESIRSGEIAKARLPIVDEAVRAQRVVTGPSTSMDIQDLYNMAHPVGQVMLKDSGDDSMAAMPSVPTGVVAVWERLLYARYLRMKVDATTPPRLGGSNSGTTESGGIHNHGGFTGQADNSGSGGYGFDSGGPVHRHSIANTGTGHTHDFTLIPQYFGISAFRRVS